MPATSSSATTPIPLPVILHMIFTNP
jgi:hypothetical protein